MAGSDLWGYRYPLGPWMLAVWRVLLLALPCIALRDAYSERIIAQKLGDTSFTAVKFSFEMTAWASKTTASGGIELDALELAPPELLDAVLANDVKDAYISFRHGRWDSENWGVHAEIPLPPSGAHVRVQFDGAETHVQDSWSQFLHSIDGLFCASFVGAEETGLYVHSRIPSSLWPSPAATDVFALFLAHEPSCTENLTPLLRQLPCRRHHGLASVVKPAVLFGAPFHSMVARVSREPATGVVSFVFEITAVLDRAERAVLSEELSQLTPCPVATPALPFSLTPALLLDHSGHAAPDVSTALRYARWQSGYDLSRARVHLRLVNTNATAGLVLSVLDHYPHFTSALVHTFTVTVLNAQGATVRTCPLFECQGVIASPQYVSTGPGKPCILSYTLTLSAAQSAVVSGTIRRRLLHVDAYPPDPNRGFDLPPVTLFPAAAAAAAGGASSQSTPTFTEPLLVRPRVPSFSPFWAVLPPAASLLACVRSCCL